LLKVVFTPTSRFHFAKALYTKLKTTYRLGHVFLKNAKPIHKKLRFVFRQFFALAMLRPLHMKGQLERLERELRGICEELPVGEATNVNKWFNVYVLGYWFRLRGADNISVFGATRATNNRMER
jgi:hypothetical protein